MTLLLCFVFGCARVPFLQPLEENVPEGAFMAVWGASPDQVWRVGGRNAGAVLVDEGGAFPQVAQTPAGLNGVAALGDGRLLVAGERGYAAVVAVEDGEGEPITPSTMDVLHRAFVIGEEMYAVGGNLFASEAGLSWGDLAREGAMISASHLIRRGLTSSRPPPCATSRAAPPRSGLSRRRSPPSPR